MLARFDGPERAVEAAIAIRRAVRGLGIEVRSGIHTGELEVTEDDVAGIAVYTAARVLAAADAGEILVSQTVKDLVAGSGLRFADQRREHCAGLLASGACTRCLSETSRRLGANGASRSGRAPSR